MKYNKNICKLHSFWHENDFIIVVKIAQISHFCFSHIHLNFYSIENYFHTTVVILWSAKLFIRINCEKKKINVYKNYVVEISQRNKKFSIEKKMLFL